MIPGMRLEKTETGFTIDAADLASLLDLAPEEVCAGMRSGAIVSRFERGEGADEGRSRLTFITAERQVRLIVDRNGAVLQRIRSPRAGGSGSTGA